MGPMKTYKDFKLNFGGGLSEGKIGREGYIERRIEEAKAKPYTFLGTLQGGRPSDKDGKESRGQQVVIDMIDVDYWGEELSKVKNPDDFFEGLEEYSDINMTPNNSRDEKKVMQAIAKKKLWVDRDGGGDSIIGTGPDKRKLRTALIDYRD
jgi:hypothetical protein